MIMINEVNSDHFRDELNKEKIDNFILLYNNDKITKALVDMIFNSEVICLRDVIAKHLYYKDKILNIFEFFMKVTIIKEKGDNNKLFTYSYNSLKEIINYNDTLENFRVFIYGMIYNNFIGRLTINALKNNKAITTLEYERVMNLLKDYCNDNKIELGSISFSTLDLLILIDSSDDNNSYNNEEEYKGRNNLQSISYYFKFLDFIYTFYKENKTQGFFNYINSINNSSIYDTVIDLEDLIKLRIEKDKYYKEGELIIYLLYLQDEGMIKSFKVINYKLSNDGNKKFINDLAMFNSRTESKYSNLTRLANLLFTTNSYEDLNVIRNPKNNLLKDYSLIDLVNDVNLIVDIKLFINDKLKIFNNEDKIKDALTIIKFINEEDLTYNERLLVLIPQTGSFIDFDHNSSLLISITKDELFKRIKTFFNSKITLISLTITEDKAGKNKDEKKMIKKKGNLRNEKINKIVQSLKNCLINYNNNNEVNIAELQLNFILFNAIYYNNKIVDFNLTKITYINNLNKVIGDNNILKDYYNLIKIIDLKKYIALKVQKKKMLI